MYHPRLQRQLKKYFSENKIPKHLIPFIEAVNDAYINSDEDLKLLERSLDISSKEMTEINTHLREEKSDLELQTERLQTANNFMVNRELKMVELKKKIAELEGAHKSNAVKTENVSEENIETQKS
jgi:two-component system, NtrC family, sensor kinase